MKGVKAGDSIITGNAGRIVRDIIKEAETVLPECDAPVAPSCVIRVYKNSCQEGRNRRKFMEEGISCFHEKGRYSLCAGVR